MSDRPPSPTILLTGATGYVGGRLLRALEERGHAVRCLARRPEALQGRVAPGTEVVQGDALKPESLPAALCGIQFAYYMVHSMGSSGDFVEEDRRAAREFGAAARAAGVRGIIYLGGLGDPAQGLSAHLRSRHETGDLLRASGVPVVEFRASIVIGSGSLSFEMIRALVERLPVMICPRWVRSMAQPIAIEDLVEYLVQALDLPPGPGAIYSIGGSEQASYGDLMSAYARARGLHRLMIPVPILTPKLSSLWLGLVTPLYARVGHKLVESLRNDSVVTDDLALRTFKLRPRGLDEAIQRALKNEDREFALTRWSDALSAAGPGRESRSARYGSRLVESRRAFVAASPAEAFAPIARIGGETGWYFADWLWQLRGFLDLLAGGVGVRRGRRDPLKPLPGDALDFWRVEAFEPGARLRLRAEMRLPGRAWLEFEVQPEGSGSSITQTAVFEPLGLLGLLYWYSLLPLHVVMFRGMLRNIARRAAERPSGPRAGGRREPREG